MQSVSRHAAMRPQPATTFPGLCLLFLAGVLLADVAGAAAHVRFASALLTEQPAADHVEIRVGDQLFDAGLGYKSATGYVELAAGAPQLRVNHRGQTLIERTLDLREGRGYLFVLQGNGSSGAPYDVTAIYEGDTLPDVNSTRTHLLMAAPYPGHPRESNLLSVPPVEFALRCRDRQGQGGTSLGGSLRYQARLLPQGEGEKRSADQHSADAKDFADLEPGRCKADVFMTLAAPGRFSANYPNIFGGHAHAFLVGDGTRAPVELWTFNQLAHAIELPPVAPGPWTAGIWVAPDYPGLSLNLMVADDRAQRGYLNGILTGLDTRGQPRWLVLRGYLPGSIAEQRFNASELIGNSAGAVNEVRIMIPLSFSLSFQDCSHARLMAGSSLQSSRTWAIAALQDGLGTSIQLQRATPFAATCPY